MQTVTADNNWKWSFTGLPKYANGTEIVYTITEDSVDGYTSAVNGYDVTQYLLAGADQSHGNKGMGGQERSGWNPTEKHYRETAGGWCGPKETLTLSSGNNWTGTFNNLDKYRDGGEEIVYTIEEVGVNGYETVISGDASKGFVITNSHTPATTEVSGSKTWDDKDDQDGKRPDSITIRLYATGRN